MLYPDIIVVRYELNELNIIFTIKMKYKSMIPKMSYK